MLSSSTRNPGLTSLPTDQSEDANRQVYNDEPSHHEGKFSHELIGGAAGFEAMKAYEDHERRNGTLVSPSFPSRSPRLPSQLASVSSCIHLVLNLTLGKPANHALAKEVIAGFAGAEVDKLAETKGMDWMDNEEAKRHARQSAERMYDDRYGGQNDGGYGGQNDGGYGGQNDGGYGQNDGGYGRNDSNDY